MADRPITTLFIGIGGSGASTAVNLKQQLYDAYDNRLPDNVRLVVLDTAKTDIVGRGAEGIVRREGMGIGQTVLDIEEKAHVGGNAYEWVREIDMMNHYPHIKSWFLSNRFLKDLPHAVFNLDEGAGMFRQFGRLALFHDVQTPGTSNIAAIIDMTLVALSRMQRSNDPAISVIVVGSLVGGTGAGMFLDIPHLVQRVADINNIKITVRGFLYLPTAFNGNLSATQLGPAQARSFAAMRELSRFIMNGNYEYAYPMYYHGGGSGLNQELWRASNTGKLYDYLYLIDGAGLNNRKLEEGSASVVADSIVSFLDPNYGPHQNQYDINVRSRIQGLQDLIGKKPFVSTLGAYSIIMPIQHIIESWSHRMSRDFINSLVPGTKNDRGQINDLSATSNPDMSVSPLDEVQRIAKSMTALPDPEKSEEMLLPLPLWGKTYDIYNLRESDEKNTVQRLYRFDLVDWLEMIVPPDQQNDHEASAVRTQTVNILREQFKDFAQTSAERKGGNPDSDGRDIEQKADRFIIQQLGQPATGGWRNGGEYADKLQLLVNMNTKRFRRYMTSYVRAQLNGEANQANPVNAKTGKLGWVIAVMMDMRAMYAKVYEVLERVHRRAQVEEDIAQALETMYTNKGKLGMFGRIQGSKAVKAQESYIATVQKYIDYYRTEYARAAVGRTLKEIMAFIDEMLESFRAWREILATDSASLYNQLLVRENHIRVDRKVVGEVANHRIIDDPHWENERYANYVTNEIIADLFKAFSWKVTLQAEGQESRFKLGATLSMGEDKDQNELLPRDKVKWEQSNVDLLLEYTRRVFRRAIKEESLLTYLLGRVEPDTLARELVSKTSYLLTYSPTEDAETMTLSHILLAHYQEDSAQLTFIRSVNQHLIAQNQKGKDNSTQIVASCVDHFRLTYLATSELILLEKTAAYIEGKSKYLELPFESRQKDHVFPAEINAIKYEKALVNTKYFDQAPDNHLLTDRVRLLLEDEERFIDFLFLLVYQLVTLEQVNDGRTIQRYWTLRAPFRDKQDTDQLDEWHLTAITDTTPSLVDAMVTYVINQHDYRNKSRTLPYAHILNYLRLVQEHNTTERVQTDTIGQHNSTIARYLKAFSPPRLSDGSENLSNWTEKDDDNFFKLAMLTARYDIIWEFLQEFRSTIPQIYKDATIALNNANTGKTRDEALRKQELYDLFSVATICLTDEIEKIYKLFERRY